MVCRCHDEACPDSCPARNLHPEPPGNSFGNRIVLNSGCVGSDIPHSDNLAGSHAGSDNLAGSDTGTHNDAGTHAGTHRAGSYATDCPAHHPDHRPQHRGCRLLAAGLVPRERLVTSGQHH